MIKFGFRLRSSALADQIRAFIRIGTGRLSRLYYLAAWSLDISDVVWTTQSNTQSQLPVLGHISADAVRNTCPARHHHMSNPSPTSRVNMQKTTTSQG
jgi:hypothetical protein